MTNRLEALLWDAIVELDRFLRTVSKTAASIRAIIMKPHNLETLMWNWIKILDRLLRGEQTRLPILLSGKFDVPVLGLTVMIDLLGMIYGLCMGLFSVTPGGSGHPMQLVATMVKVPALFLLTLLVTFPSLYVFNALVGSPLFVLSVLRLLIASLAVMLATLASIGPIVSFFSFTTTSYPFMVLFNVAVFAIAGFLGLAFLLQTLRRLTIASAALAQPALTDSDPGPLEPPADNLLAPHVKVIFQIWVVVFGLVGAQMAWVLRPFIGHPGQPFTWFRHIHSNFFIAVMDAARALLS
jgi:hypothetical protein